MPAEAPFFRDIALVFVATGVSVLALRRHDGPEVLNPPPETVMRPGDQVTVIGMPDQIALFERLNSHAWPRGERAGR